MGQLVTVAKVGDIAPGRGKAFVVGKLWIAVFLVDGRYFALENDCPHMGAPLHTGEIHNGMVVCDRHLWAFRLDDGGCADAATLQARTFPVHVAGEAIQVEVPEGAVPPAAE